MAIMSAKFFAGGLGSIGFRGARLIDALARSKDEKTGAVVHQIEVPVVDVANVSSPTDASRTPEHNTN